MATKPVNEKKPKVEVVVPGTDVVPGDPGYDQLKIAWMQESKPPMLEYRGKHYMVLQDPETTEYFFRGASKEGLYGSRSF